VGDYTVGVDIGGTKVAAVLIGGDGEVRARARIATDVARGSGAVVSDVARVVQELVAEARADEKPRAVGVGVAGQIDGNTGTVLFAPNLNWSNVPLRKELESSVGVPVVVVNDVQAATFGEARRGVGRGTPDLVSMFVGTGIGGGVVSGGRLTSGCCGSAGEFGHVSVDMNGPRCRCGNIGCAEAFAGGWAIAERAKNALEANSLDGAILRRHVDGDIARVAARDVIAASREGDALAMRLMREAQRALGTLAVSLANAFNPCTIVLGGGIIEGYPEAVDAVRKHVHDLALGAATRCLAIARAELGEEAGSIGAALYAGMMSPRT
jgi:glucokinase